MAAILDLRKPTLVATGFWNQSILNEPGWIGEHVLRLLEGEGIEVGHVVIGDGGAPRKTISFYENFGIFCSPVRLELYRVRQESSEALHDAIGKISSLLPHSPVFAIGVNYHFAISQDLELINESMKTDENYDELGSVATMEKAETVKIDFAHQMKLASELVEPCILKIQRRTDFESASIDFNFHQEISGIASLAEWKEHGPIDYWIEFVKKSLNKQYEISEWETVSFLEEGS